MGSGSFMISGADANVVREARMMFTIIVLQSLQMFMSGPCIARGGGALVIVRARCSGGRCLFRLLLMTSGGVCALTPARYCGPSGVVGTEPDLK